MGLFPAQPAHPQANRLSRAVGQAVHRLRRARIPFRPGQVVVGDDPFNGRRQGTVEVIRPPYLGLRIPGTPAGSLVFFDYRTVRDPE
jgi:hypothetical protein